MIEGFGFGCIWQGGSPTADLAHVQVLLEATTKLKVAPSIVNIWASDPLELARAYHRIELISPGRLLLGIGVGHPEANSVYETPFQALARYLDVLDAEGVPVERRVLAALGPKMLDLAGERAAGAHPYLTTPEHTLRARESLGMKGLLAPEQRIVMTTDLQQARDIGRRSIATPYLGLRNYVANWKRLGFDSSDLAGTGSDRLIDALVVSGDGPGIRTRLEAHHNLGADHVAVHLIDHVDVAVDRGYGRLARLLRLT
jgi:probable F420-dependent oxidoreductase